VYAAVRFKSRQIRWKSAVQVLLPWNHGREKFTATDAATSTGIDPIQVLELQRIIFDLKRSGIGILVTDHNVREALSVTDRAYIINNGRIFRAGVPEALGRDPEVKRIHLGESFEL
jgi:ABC-type lipopolysaccharide export system ATPase subunit